MTYWDNIREIVQRETTRLASQSFVEDEDLKRLKLLADIAKAIPAQPAEEVAPPDLSDLDDDELEAIARGET